MLCSVAAAITTSTRPREKNMLWSIEGSKPWRNMDVEYQIFSVFSQSFMSTVEQGIQADRLSSERGSTLALM